MTDLKNENGLSETGVHSTENHTAHSRNHSFMESDILHPHLFVEYSPGSWGGLTGDHDHSHDDEISDETMGNLVGEPVFTLYISMLLDKVPQSVDLIDMGTPLRGQGYRDIVLVVQDNPVSNAYTGREYYEQYRIDNRLEGEEMVRVSVKHLATAKPHGGSGSIHYPPGGGDGG